MNKVTDYSQIINKFDYTNRYKPSKLNQYTNKDTLNNYIEKLMNINNEPYIEFNDNFQLIYLDTPFIGLGSNDCLSIAELATIQIYLNNMLISSRLAQHAPRKIISGIVKREKIHSLNVKFKEDRGVSSNEVYLGSKGVFNLSPDDLRLSVGYSEFIDSTIDFTNIPSTISGLRYFYYGVFNRLRILNKVSKLRPVYNKLVEEYKSWSENSPNDELMLVSSDISNLNTAEVYKGKVYLGYSCNGDLKFTKSGTDKFVDSHTNQLLTTKVQLSNI